MRLSAWISTRGKGSIAHLARETGLAYQTVHRLAHEQACADFKSALLIHRLTRGAVSIESLCDPTGEIRKHCADALTAARKRRADARALKRAA